MKLIKRTSIEAGVDDGNGANEQDATSSKKPRSSTLAAAAAAAIDTSPVSIFLSRRATADRDQMLLSELGDFGIFGGDLLASAAVGGAEVTNLPPRGAMAPQPDEVDDDEDMPPLPPPLLRAQVKVAANDLFSRPGDLAGARLSSLKNDMNSAIDAAVDAAVGESSPGRWERAWDSFCYHNASAAAKAKPLEHFFPNILHEVLSCADEEVTDALAWLPHGQAFSIKNPQNLENKVLPRFFGKGKYKYSSFIRKLNRWGFRRVTAKGDPDSGAWRHQLFLRDQPDLARDMSRQKAGSVRGINYAKRRQNALESLEASLEGNAAAASALLPDYMVAASLPQRAYHLHLMGQQSLVNVGVHAGFAAAGGYPPPPPGFPLPSNEVGDSPPDQAYQAKTLVQRGGDPPVATAASMTAAANGSEMISAADTGAAMNEAELELRAYREVQRRMEAYRAVGASRAGARKVQVPAGGRAGAVTKPRRPANGFNLFVKRQGSKAKERDRVWKVYSKAVNGNKMPKKLPRIATTGEIARLWGANSELNKRFEREAKEHREFYRAQSESWEAADRSLLIQNKLSNHHSKNQHVECSIPLLDASPAKPRRPANGYNLFLKQHGSKAKERDRVWEMYSRAVNGNKKPKKLSRIATTGDIARLWGANSEMREKSEREATEQQESYRAQIETWRAAECFQGRLLMLRREKKARETSVAATAASKSVLTDPQNDVRSSTTAAATMTAADTIGGAGNCASGTVVPANVGVGAPAVSSWLLQQQPPSQPWPQLMTTPATLEEMYRLQVERQRLPVANLAAIPQFFLPQQNAGPALALQQAQVPGWKMGWDPVSTCSYFYNTITGEVTWLQ